VNEQIHYNEVQSTVVAKGGRYYLEVVRRWNVVPIIVDIKEC